MVAASTDGTVNACRQALITNFGNADPTASLQGLVTSGGALVMTIDGPGTGPQNVFDGNAATQQPSGVGNLTISQFLDANPDTNAVTDRASGNIFLDDSFNNRGPVGMAQDIIHEGVAHKGNNRRDDEFTPAGTNPRDARTAGSGQINEIIRRNCNVLRP